MKVFGVEGVEVYDSQMQSMLGVQGLGWRGVSSREGRRAHSPRLERVRVAQLPQHNPRNPPSEPLPRPWRFKLLRASRLLAFWGPKASGHWAQEAPPPKFFLGSIRNVYQMRSTPGVCFCKQRHPLQV